MADSHVRPVDDEYVATPDDFETLFSNGYPCLTNSEVSRVEGCRQAVREIGMTRFLSDIVVEEGEGIEQFDEDY